MPVSISATILLKSVGGQASQPAKGQTNGFEAVLNGMGDEIACGSADLDKGLSPKAIIDNSLIPAIQRWGVVRG